MNKLQTVYIPTKTEDDLPKKSCKCGIIKKGEFDLSYFIKAPSYELFDHVKSGLSHTQSEITHWLKPTEAFVFTPEELKQLLSDIFDAGIDWITDTSDFPMGNCKKQFSNKVEYIENILNKEK
jgi:hypothetical protein